jgi:hypothetical protein
MDILNLPARIPELKVIVRARPTAVRRLGTTKVVEQFFRDAAVRHNVRQTVLMPTWDVGRKGRIQPWPNASYTRRPWFRTAG